MVPRYSWMFYTTHNLLRISCMILSKLCIAVSAPHNLLRIMQLILSKLWVVYVSVYMHRIFFANQQPQFCQNFVSPTAHQSRGPPWRRWECWWAGCTSPSHWWSWPRWLPRRAETLPSPGTEPSSVIYRETTLGWNFISLVCVYTQSYYL